MARLAKLFVAALLFASIALQGADLCSTANPKPVLSLQQMTQAQLVDLLCELSGLKDSPNFPKDISKMSPDEYFQKEVAILVDNGFPPILLDVSPKATVNRRFFSSLMFEIALEKDPAVQKDCKASLTETQQIDCLTQHNYLFNKGLQIYEDEILSVLCSKKDILKKLMPRPKIKPPDINLIQFKEGILEMPGTLEHRWDKVH